MADEAFAAETDLERRQRIAAYSPIERAERIKDLRELLKWNGEEYRDAVIEDPLSMVAHMTSRTHIEISRELAELEGRALVDLGALPS